MTRSTEHRQLSATFPPTHQSPRQAREFVAAGLRETGVDETDLAERVRVIVSELVTNAVLHAGTNVEVRLAVGPGHVWLEVMDGGTAHAHRVTAPVTSTSGRGLQLVDALADAWGVATMDGGRGKAVWGRVGRG